MSYSFNIYDFSYLIRGVIVTILLCLGTMTISLPIALLVGFIRSVRSQNLPIKILKFVMSIFISAVRGTPLMLQLMFLFFGLPFMGINLSSMFSGLLGLTVYSTAYLAEIVRTGIDSISKEQWDASAALGLSYMQSMRAVILPQAFRIMIPPAVGFFIGLIKDSSLCAVIGFIELARAGRIIVEKTHQSLLIFSLISVLYFMICYPLSNLSQKIEHKLKLKGVS